MSRFAVHLTNAPLNAAHEIPFSDVALLEHLCSTEEDSSLYAEFLKRFLPDVEKECSRQCTKRKVDPHIGKQIAHDTFERVRKYKKFRKDEIKLPNERKAIMVYLFRISTRLFNDHHRISNKKEIIHKTYFDDLALNFEASCDAERLKKIKDTSELIFKVLNKNEKIVLLKDIEYKKHHRYLPDEVLDELAETLSVKRDSVRKIRERAIDKINKAFNAINQN